jgi:hypothetical protein
MTRSKSCTWFMYFRRHAVLAFLAAIAGSAVVSMSSAAEKQPSYATPEQAVDTLLSAMRSGNIKELVTILGPGSKKLVTSGDSIADARARDKFVAEYENAHEIKQESDARNVLVVGKDDWPFPFPIVKDGVNWRFDESAGADEIIDRRIGDNELSAIEVCHAYVAAQREYAEQDRNHNGFLEYAQKFASSPGRHDGLYWPSADGQEESPLGPLMANARAEGYGHDEGRRGRKPYHGYFYRILKGQGEAARDGAYRYIVNGKMIAGFAMVAFPAQYDVSGVMTFIVNHDGIVYQKDLGPHTAEIAEKMTLFNPDPSWKTP